MIQDYERSHPKLMMQSQGIYSSSKYLTCLYASQVKFCQVKSSLPTPFLYVYSPCRLR